MKSLNLFHQIQKTTQHYTALYSAHFTISPIPAPHPPGDGPALVDVHQVEDLPDVVLGNVTLHL